MSIMKTDHSIFSNKNAFSLVELSIVLVILGLLAGGVLSGQALIRAAELRSVSADISRFNTSISAFRDKYFALPGDMRNATSFWGDDNAACLDADIPNGTPGTCNGNSDGMLSGGAGVGATAEIFQFWKQLALANLIEGTYSGLSNPAGSAAGRSALPEYNVPKSRLGDSNGYSIEYQGAAISHPILWNGNYGNAFIFGAGLGTCCPTEGPILKTDEAWNIDTKLDDGKPSQGFIRTFYRRSYEATAGATFFCSTTDAESTAAYNLSDLNARCNLIINTGY